MVRGAEQWNPPAGPREPARTDSTSTTPLSMKPLALILAPIVLATTALAGDIQVTGVGQVVSIDPSPLSGTFAGVSVGDSFEMVVEVFDTPAVLGFGARTYPVDAAAGGLTVGPASVSYRSSSEPLTIVNSSFTGDQLAIGVDLDAPGDLLGVMLLTDTTGLALPTEDLSQLVGTTFTQPPTSLVAGVSPGNGANAPTIVVQLSEIRISGGGTPGGGGTGPYCTAIPNSTGSPGTLTATGSFTAADNDVTLTATSLPANTFGIFVTSRIQGFVFAPGGSVGNLCLGGAIGRYNAPGQILSSGAGGSFSMALDLTRTPTPNAFVAVAAGETWNFQAWHRDFVSGVSTSNFTNGYQIDFQ